MRARQPTAERGTMSEAVEPKPGVLKRLGKWLRLKVVQEAPEEVAVCEFECRKSECTRGEWETCARRLAGIDLAQPLA
jgi:hypothetical protein